MSLSAKYMVRYGGLPGLDVLLARHPRLLQPQPGSLCALDFGLNSYWRSIVIGYQPDLPVGVVELYDNNPLVCAKRVCLPTPAAALALLALDPLVKSGLAEGTFRLACSMEVQAEEVKPFLDALGARTDVEFTPRAQVEEGNVAVEVRLSEHIPSSDLTEFYDDAYGRWMLVRRHPADHPLAASYSVYCDESGVAIRLESPIIGKAGAAQVVQAMNVMAGFEDSLGLA